MWGKPARFSDIPKVKAYIGPLPPNKKGIEFTTDIEPDGNTPLPLVFWTGPREGVRVEEEYAILKLLTLANHQK